MVNNFEYIFCEVDMKIRLSNKHWLWCKSSTVKFFACHKLYHEWYIARKLVCEDKENFEFIMAWKCFLVDYKNANYVMKWKTKKKEIFN
jgi:hypothetical protein